MQHFACYAVTKRLQLDLLKSTDHTFTESKTIKRDGHLMKCLTINVLSQPSEVFRAKRVNDTELQHSSRDVY